MDISTRTVEAMRFAVIEAKGPSIDFRKAWTELHPTVRAQGLARPGARFASLFEADELRAPMSMAWYAAALQLEEGQVASAPLTERSVEAGSYVTRIYTGPYEGLASAWGGFIQSILLAEYPPDMSRPCVERYLDAAPQAEPRTELFVPVI